MNASDVTLGQRVMVRVDPLYQSPYLVWYAGTVSALVCMLPDGSGEALYLKDARMTPQWLNPAYTERRVRVTFRDDYEWVVPLSHIRKPMSSELA